MSFWEVLPQQRFEFRSTVIPKVQEFGKVIKYVLPERDDLFHGECSCPPLCGRPPALTIWGPVVRSFYEASGRSSTCQVAYLSLGVCGLHGIPVREGKPVVAALPWLSTNIGSRHATLAAKKAWIQWSTAKRLENSSSWKTETSGGKKRLKGAKVISPLDVWEFMQTETKWRKNIQTLSKQTNNFPSPFQNLLCVSRCKTSLSLSDTLQPECLCCGWSKPVEQSTWKYPNGSGHWRLGILAGNSYLCSVWSSIIVFLVVRAALSML